MAIIFIYFRITIYLVGLYIVSIQGKILQLNSKVDNSALSGKYLDYINLAKGIRVIYFGLEPSDLLIKNIMGSGISVTVEIKSIEEWRSNSTFLGCEEQIELDWLAIIESKNTLVISSRSNSQFVVPKRCLTHKVNFFIYMIENEQYTNTTSGNEFNFCLLIPTNLLMRNLTECCMENVTSKSQNNCDFPHFENLRRSNVEHKRERWPDMMGEVIEAVTFHRPISTIIHRSETDPKKRYDGLEMNIFIEIAKRLNMSWRVDELEGQQDKWGQLYNGTWKGGVMEALTLGTADVGFATLWMSPLQVPYLDYTTSWGVMSSTYLVPRPIQVDISWESLVRPFTLPVWAALAISLLLFPAIIWITIQLSRILTQEEPSAKQRNLSLGSYITYTFGSITGGSGMLGNLNDVTGRILVSWWYVFILLLCNSYTSKIMACLTVPYFTPKIDSVHQLVDENFHWGRTYHVDNLFQHLDIENYWHRQFAKNFIIFNGIHLTSMLMSKRFVIVVQQIEDCDHIFMDYPIEEKIAENFRVMKEKTRTYRIGFGFRKHSPLLPIFNAVLERLFETGLVDYLKSDAVRRFQRPAYQRILVETDNGILSRKGIAALTLENYKFIFYLYIFGLCVSLGVFLMEFCSDKVVVVKRYTLSSLVK